MKPQPNTIICGDIFETLKTWDNEFVDCVVTSPPYWGLRDYGVEGQIGLEKTPEEYVAKMVLIFREIKRVLKKDGTCWLNLGDSYANEKVGNTETKIHKKAVQNTYKKGKSGLPPKNLVGIPWRVAFALQADGWYLRQDIIWHKPNPMPESVTDRCTKSHEYIFLLTKNPRYYFDNEAIKEVATGYDGRKDTIMKGSEKYKDGECFVGGNANSLSIKGRERWKYKNLQENGQQSNTMHEKRLMGEEYLSPVRNKRSVWTVTTKPYSEAHFATFPPDLIIPPIKTTRPDALILDPFMGSGTTAYVARMLGRNYLGIELNPEYIKLAEKRLAQQVLL